MFWEHFWSREHWLGNTDLDNIFPVPILSLKPNLTYLFFSPPPPPHLSFQIRNGRSLSSKFCNIHIYILDGKLASLNLGTVNPVYNGQPWDPKIVAVVD